jgi:hypothetical protein
VIQRIYSGRGSNGYMVVGRTIHSAQSEWAQPLVPLTPQAICSATFY